MPQPLTEPEKKRIHALLERGWEYPEIAGDIAVGRHLREFTYLVDNVKEYMKLTAGVKG